LTFPVLEHVTALGMTPKKSKTARQKAIIIQVKAEMAKPRISASARIAESAEVSPKGLIETRSL
jgi:hypothetical protein